MLGRLRTALGSKVGMALTAAIVVFLAGLAVGLTHGNRAETVTVDATSAGSAELTISNALRGLDGEVLTDPAVRDRLDALGYDAGAIDSILATFPAESWNHLGGRLMLTGGGAAFRTFPLTVTATDQPNTYQAWSVAIIAGGTAQANLQSWATLTVTVHEVDGAFRIASFTAEDGPHPGGLAQASASIPDLLKQMEDL